MRKNTKTLLIITLLLTALLSGCTRGEYFDDSVDILAADELITKTETATAENSATEDIDSNLPQIRNYIYQPPKEVMNTHFYSDSILQNIDFEYLGYDTDFMSVFKLPDGTILTAEMFYDDQYMTELYNDFSKIIPKEIVDDMRRGAENISVTQSGVIESKLVAIDYMRYDMNSDGVSDYIVIGTVADAVAQGIYPSYNSFLYKIYLLNEHEELINSINWDCFYLYKISRHFHILSTKTNELYDLMVLHNANYPIITYDGADSYTESLMLDEKHTFIDTAQIDNIMKIKMFISVPDTQAGDYYVAFKISDNKYFKNDIFYSCYPDGTPQKYTTFPFESDYSFSPAIDGYDFYMEIKEGVIIPADYLPLPIEIKYIPVAEEYTYSQTINTEPNDMTEKKLEADQEFYIVQGVDESLFSLIDTHRIYGIDLKPIIPNKWKEKIDDMGLLEWGKSTSGVAIDDYVIIMTYGDVTSVGNMQGPEYYLVLSDDIFTNLEPSGYAHRIWYYISDDMVHIYEYNNGGIISVILTSYYLETGEVSFLYNAVYQLGSSDLLEWSIIPPNVGNTDELQEYVLGISDTWYR